MNINLITEEEVHLILTSLPQLKKLNGKEIKITEERDINGIVDLDNEDIKNISFRNEISFINETYRKVNENLKRNRINDNFKDTFQTLIKNEINKINSNEANAPNYIYATTIIESQLSIYSFFFEKFIAVLDKKEEIALSEVSKMLHENISRSYLFLIKIIYQLYPKITAKTEMLKKQLNEAFVYVHSVEKEINVFEMKVKNITKEKDAIISKLKDENDLLRMKLQKSEKENKLMFDKLMADAKKIIEENEDSKRELKGVQRGDNESHKENKIQIHNSLMSNKLLSSSSNLKMISIRNIKETINEIYSSKIDCDKITKENNLPKETLEQHMYSFINQKYGLKQIIIEYTTNFMNGVCYYSNEDNDIYLFAKILKNEIDEKFKLHIDQFRKTISDKLFDYLTMKYPFKNKSEITKMQREKICGYLIEEEWKYIISILLEEKDNEYIDKKIYDMSLSNSKKLLHKDNRKLTREEIINQSKYPEENKVLYYDIEYCIIELKIKQRENYLKNFVILFRKFDHDYDGIITEEEFIKMIYSANIFGTETQEKIIEYLSIIDPNNHQHIIFTACVDLFTSQLYEGKPVMDLLIGNK